VNDDARQRVDFALPRLLEEHFARMIEARLPASLDARAGEVDV
jgi:hypothetical protein